MTALLCAIYRREIRIANAIGTLFTVCAAAVALIPEALASLCDLWRCAACERLRARLGKFPGDRTGGRE